MEDMLFSGLDLDRVFNMQTKNGRIIFAIKYWTIAFELDRTCLIMNALNFVKVPLSPIHIISWNAPTLNFDKFILKEEEIYIDNKFKF